MQANGELLVMYVSVVSERLHDDDDDGGRNKEKACMQKQKSLHRSMEKKV